MGLQRSHSRFRMLTGLQIRTARKLLGWAAWRLALKAKLSIKTLRRAEIAAGEAPLTLEQAYKIGHALEVAGIEFTNDREPGVKLKAKGR